MHIHTHAHTYIHTHTHAYTYIISKLDYYNSILTDIPTFQERRLNKIINQTCRLIFKLPERTHTTDYRKKLNWLTFKQRSTYKTLNIIHTAIYNNLPKYIIDSITFHIHGVLYIASQIFGDISISSICYSFRYKVR